MPQLYPNRRYTRDKAPLGILRGYRPTEPGHLSVTAAPKDGENIKQGMAITLDSTGEWVKASLPAAGLLQGLSVYVARQDQDDPAVQASGKLTGLDCSGEFEFQTGYVAAGTYAIDDELTIQDDNGLFALAVSGDKVVGKVSAKGSGANGLIPYSGLTPPTATAAAAERVQFKTVASYIKA